MAINTADVKFTVADINSTLTTAPPPKATVEEVPVINIEIDFSLDTEKVLDINEFTTNVERTVGVDDNFVVIGEGIFDKLMETATEHLAVQFTNGRIRGEDYSSAYIQVFQATLQAAITIWVQKGLNEKQLALELAAKNAELKLQAKLKEKELKLQADLAKNQNDLHWAVALLQRDAQEELVKEQTASERQKSALIKRQIEGFDENYKTQILKILMDSWVVGFSVAKDAFGGDNGAGIPDLMTKTAIDDLYGAFIVPDFDRYKYGRQPDVTEVTPEPDTEP